MSAAPLTASLVVIGDEILGGFTRDENVGWLAERLRAHGVDLVRVAIVPDEHDVIRDEVTAALDRPRPHLVLTTGGIGSTPDDITYEAVAAALGQDLVVAPLLAAGIDRIVAWTAEQGFDVDDDFVDHLMRMARVPAGAEPLEEARGWMLGVHAEVDGGLDAPGGAAVVVLPGVPTQLRRIVGQVVEPRCLEGRGADVATAEVTHGFPESALNRCLARLGVEVPTVKVGSYPGSPMVVRLRGPEADVERARAIVERHLADLEADPGGRRLLEAWTARFARVGEEDAT